MRILWITGNFYPQVGGLQVYIDKVTNSLADHAEIGLITEDYQFPPANPKIAHFPVSGLTRPESALAWNRSVSAVRSAAAEFRPDLVHFSNANVTAYWPALPEFIPAVATVHGNDLTAPWQLTPGHDTTACIVAGLNRCEQITAVSNHGASLIRQWGVRAPVTVLTSGCDLDFFRPLPETVAETRSRYGLSLRDPLVFTAARLVPRKGHLLALDAISRIPFPVFWLVAGEGSERARIQAQIFRAGLGDRVCLLGEITNEELLALYNACDVFVFTPDERRMGAEFIDSEGFGLVLHEAGACGKPVIATDVSGCKEAVFHGITGLLTPPNDPVSLSHAIQRVLSEEKFSKDLGNGGMALVHTLGGWPRLAAQFYELYERVTENIFNYRSELT